MKLTRRIIIASPLLCALPLQAMPVETRRLIDNFAKGKPLRREKLTLDLNSLIENGNSIAIKVSVNYPFTEQNFITRILLVSEKNPQNEIGEFSFSPMSGKAEVTTRIRLATSQAIHAVAESNKGEYFYDFKDTIVTLAACLEE